LGVVRPRGGTDRAKSGGIGMAARQGKVTGNAPRVRGAGETVKATEVANAKPGKLGVGGGLYLLKNC